jgi:membrane protein
MSENTELDKNLDRVRAALRDLDQILGGTFTILGMAARRFGDVSAAEASASLSYYTLFSLFPLLLIVVSIGSRFLEVNVVQDQIFQFLNQLFPVSSSFIQSTIEQVLTQRGTVSILGLVGLAWSASGAFTVLVKHINRAWPEARVRGVIQLRIFGLGFIGIIIGLWFVTVLMLNFLPQVLPLSGLPDFIFEGSPLPEISNWVSILLTFVLFLVLYRSVPSHYVKWSQAFWGAVAATIGWQLAYSIFNWYLTSGFSTLNLVYGSLGAIVAFMFWVYISSMIALGGAHISAAIFRYHRDVVNNSDNH